ncbi:GTP pyrophosphokinase [Neoaquamicrobium sediminum]|uniref:RelA/SpoT domain-containing protein n=1 Tax=Neoaquamicrobium sediminum TaxID=1849104 RepID=A0ABV3WYT1_9HYPH
MTDVLRDLYEKRAGSMRRAEARIRSILGEVVTTIEDRKLVRAELSGVRVKGLESIRRKAASHGWPVETALTSCADLIGARIVCNNVEDVYRFAELLKERLNLDHFELQDQIKAPKTGGYRAVHINFWLDVGEHPFQAERLPCEVQIRSRLQDAWAVLSHDDIYKHDDLPDDLRARFKDLAEVLSAADRIASDIRLRVRQETTPPAERPRFDTVTPAGLAWIFGDIFGRSARDFLIRQAENVVADLGITSLMDLTPLLSDDGFRKAVDAAYRSSMPLGPSTEDIFLAGLGALKLGREQAIEQVRRDAREEWSEIDEIGRREALSSLPPTMDDLLDVLEAFDSEGDIGRFADAFDVVHGCPICGTGVVDAGAFAEAAMKQYDVEDDDDIRERIETAVTNSGVDTGGWGDGSLCAYHNEQAGKDD